MKSFGFLLITVGFLAASWVTVQHPTEVSWGLFLPLAGVAVFGVVVARMATRAEATEGTTVSGNIESLREAIDRIAVNIAQMDEEKGDKSPYEYYPEIDRVFPEDLTIFVEARKSIGHAYGLNAYADVMNSFAAGERYLNRVWSCSVDGYIDEAQEYLGKAREQFVETKGKLDALGGRGGDM